MSRPVITAYSFDIYSAHTLAVIARLTVETPTKLGLSHAERCALVEAQKIPRCRAEAGLITALRSCQSAAAYRKARQDAINATLRCRVPSPAKI